MIGDGLVSFSSFTLSSIRSISFSVIKIYRHIAVTFLRNKVSSNGIVSLHRTLRTHLCKNICQRRVVIQVFYILSNSVTSVSSLTCSVALIVICIAFLSNKHAVLNSSPYKLVFSVVFIECRLYRANNPYKISVKVVLIRSIAVRNKLIQSIVNILSISTIFGFQDAVAYVVISIGITSNLFALSDGLRGQTI